MSWILWTFNTEIEKITFLSQNELLRIKSFAFLECLNLHKSGSCNLSLKFFLLFAKNENDLSSTFGRL